MKLIKTVRIIRDSSVQAKCSNLQPTLNDVKTAINKVKKTTN